MNGKLGGIDADATRVGIVRTMGRWEVVNIVLLELLRCYTKNTRLVPGSVLKLKELPCCCEWLRLLQRRIGGDTDVYALEVPAECYMTFFSR